MSHDESESDTVTMEEEEGYEETETEPLLQEECAPAQNCHAGCSSAHVTHSAS